jgi:hypothetical protein
MGMDLITSISIGKKNSSKRDTFQLAEEASIKSATINGALSFLQAIGLSIMSLGSQLSFHACV